jgi:hypothetical protein
MYKNHCGLCHCCFDFLLSQIPSNILVVLSNAKSTHSSMGCIIKGIEPNPAAVGAHFETTRGRPTVRLTANRDALTIVLMTPPGIATLAKLC